MFKQIREWWHRKRQDALLPERKFIVTFDEQEVSVAFPGAETRTIAWRKVQRIAIETNDSGPWGADFWWRLEGEDTICAYPQGATGELEVMEELLARFPDFSHDAYGDAIRCTTDARFLCWERADAL